MNILLLIAIGSLFFIAAFAMWIGSIHSRYRNRIRKLRLEKISKENKLTEEQKEVTALKKRVQMLQTQVETLSHEQSRSVQGPKRNLSVIESLTQAGIIGDAEIERAEVFKKTSQNDAPLEEIFILLNMVTPKQIEQAKSGKL